MLPDTWMLLPPSTLRGVLFAWGVLLPVLIIAVKRWQPTPRGGWLLAAYCIPGIIFGTVYGLLTTLQTLMILYAPFGEPLIFEGRIIHASMQVDTVLFLALPTLAMVGFARPMIRSHTLSPSRCGMIEAESSSIPDSSQAV